MVSSKPPGPLQQYLCPLQKINSCLGTSQMAPERYSPGGSSDAAFRSPFCSNLFLLQPTVRVSSICVQRSRSFFRRFLTQCWEQSQKSSKRKTAGCWLRWRKHVCVVAAVRKNIARDRKRPRERLLKHLTYGFNFYIVMYLSCSCVCIFELATPCSQRTISFLYYS